MTKPADAREQVLLDTMFGWLLTIARGPCNRAICTWDNLCGSCFAADGVARFLELPEMRRWKRHWRVVRKRKSGRRVIRKAEPLAG